MSDFKKKRLIASENLAEASEDKKNCQLHTEITLS